MYVTPKRPAREHHNAGPPADPVRSGVRFPLQLPVEFRAGDRVVPALTLDVSSTGMLCSPDSVLPVGTELDWDLHLPAEVMGTAITVVCHGRVVWVEGSSPVRMAVSIDQYRMKENTL